MLRNALRSVKNRLLGKRSHQEPWRDPARWNEITRNFHGLYYDAFRRGKTWADTWFLGVKTEKCPLDLWLYQELIHRLQPDIVIETGTRFGGSALFVATMLDVVKKGRVITIDVDGDTPRPVHARIAYITGSSVDASIVESVRRECTGQASVLVLLDSDHSKAHVLNELRAYSSMVTVGSYVVVEDTNINGHPVLSNFGPGPAEAVEEFLREDGRFTVDSLEEKFLLSFNPRGFLRRAS